MPPFIERYRARQAEVPRCPCGAPATVLRKKLCSACDRARRAAVALVIRRSAESERNAARLLAGLCRCCPLPSLADSAYCEEHRERQRRQNRESMSRRQEVTRARRASRRAQARAARLMEVQVQNDPLAEVARLRAVLAEVEEQIGSIRYREVNEGVRRRLLAAQQAIGRVLEVGDEG